jgi:hypothetical protein
MGTPLPAHCGAYRFPDPPRPVQLRHQRPGAVRSAAAGCTWWTRCAVVGLMSPTRPGSWLPAPLRRSWPTASGWSRTRARSSWLGDARGYRPGQLGRGPRGHDRLPQCCANSLAGPRLIRSLRDRTGHLGRRAPGPARATLARGWLSLPIVAGASRCRGWSALVGAPFQRVDLVIEAFGGDERRMTSPHRRIPRHPVEVRHVAVPPPRAAATHRHERRGSVGASPRHGGLRRPLGQDSRDGGGRGPRGPPGPGAEWTVGAAVSRVVGSATATVVVDPAHDS